MIWLAVKPTNEIIHICLKEVNAKWYVGKLLYVGIMLYVGITLYVVAKF